jgi:hypothetical protein
LLLVGPLLPWFHTELITPQPRFAGAAPTSLLAGLLGTSRSNVSGALGIAYYSILALGANVAGIKTLTAAARRQPRRGEGGDARVGVLASLCGAGLLGLFMAGMASVNGRIPLDWTDARVVFDAGYAGYYVTLAGFVVALLGNILIALAYRKNKRAALV